MKSAPVKETPPPSRRLTHAERFAAYRRLVDFVNKKTDRRCAVLGAMGFSTGFIASKTELSLGQVGYRLHKAGILRSEFRNGSSGFAKTVLQTASTLVDAKLDSHLLTHIPTLYDFRESSNGTNGHGANGKNGHGKNGHGKRRH